MIHARAPRSLLLAVLLALALPVSALAQADRWEIDPEHFAVGFLVDHAGFAKVLGMFLEAEGEFTFDPQTRELREGYFVVQTDSVFTNHEERDDHLRSDDFLNVAEYPEMRFTATQYEPTGDDTGRLTGDLELLGETRPVTLDVTINKVGRYPFPLGGMFGRPYVLGASMRGSFDRSDFGMTYGLTRDIVGDEVELIIEFEAQRQ
ncbi:YceI family protein [Thioalkalivibrio sp. HL-Eb18]|uniref:YceI family protein n=1 Tax=Thioalkalivibrio sp. HL-Eb18 TaxID=1266913 RepID=UPI0003629946|nr:YceI family protein [Thioalkalivibrio sp. HL-Eb18]